MHTYICTHVCTWTLYNVNEYACTNMDRQTDRHTDRQTDGLMGGWMVGWKDNRHTYRQTDRQTDMVSSNCGRLQTTPPGT